MRTVQKQQQVQYSKKTTLHLQHTCFVHFFAVVLHDYKVKLPETSWLHVLWRECRTFSCSFFFFSLPHFFTLVAANISYFPIIIIIYSFTVRFLTCQVIKSAKKFTKIFMLLFRQKNVSFVFYLSLQFSLSLFSC